MELLNSPRAIHELYLIIQKSEMSQKNFTKGLFITLCENNNKSLSAFEIVNYRIHNPRRRHENRPRLQFAKLKKACCVYRIPQSNRCRLHAMLWKDPYSCIQKVVKIFRMWGDVPPWRQRSVISGAVIKASLESQPLNQGVGCLFVVCLT